MQVAQTAPGVRRPRSRLSRSRILAEALALVDEEGLDALTMRRLAERLKVDPMSLYNHVDGKEALLDGLAEALWDEVQVPTGDGTGWEEILRSLAVSLRGLGPAHPNAYELLCGRGILTLPALSVMDYALLALENAGLSHTLAADTIRTLVAYAVGYAMLELSAPPSTGNGLEQVVQLTRALPKDAPIHLVEVAQLICDCDMDYQFNLGLNLILTGLEAHLQKLPVVPQGHVITADR